MRSELIYDGTVASIAATSFLLQSRYFAPIFLRKWWFCSHEHICVPYGNGNGALFANVLLRYFNFISNIFHNEYISWYISFYISLMTSELLKSISKSLSVCLQNITYLALHTASLSYIVVSAIKVVQSALCCSKWSVIYCRSLAITAGRI